MKLGRWRGRVALGLTIVMLDLALAGCGKYGKPRRSDEAAAAGEAGPAATTSATTNPDPANGAVPESELRDETDPRLDGNRR